MKTKLVFIGIIVIVIFSALTNVSKKKYYYAYNEKIYLYPEENKLIINYDKGVNKENSESFLKSISSEVKIKWRNLNSVIVTTKTEKLKKDLITKLHSRKDVYTYQPFYKLKNGVDMIMTNEIIVRFLPKVSKERQNELHKKYNTEVVENYGIFQKIQIPKWGDALEIANKYYESGSGKSTLISLLQNMYPLQSGTISIGDFDLQYIENNSLRQLVSAVPQKIDLFAGNVIDNIAVGEFQPNMELILSICKNIGIQEFIETLPNGFNTYLGENGASLSGGQKQRITIARALYKQPEILVLDEATSSLDSTSENYIQRTIQNLREQQKTIIVIAHRLSTVVNADEIVVLEKGIVLEQGSHNELYNKKEHYYNLWQQQIPILTM